MATTKPTDTAYIGVADYGYEERKHLVIAPNPIQARRRLTESIGFLPERCVTIQGEMKTVVKKAETDGAAEI